MFADHKTCFKKQKKIVYKKLKYFCATVSSQCKKRFNAILKLFHNDLFQENLNIFVQFLKVSASAYYI